MALSRSVTAVALATATALTASGLVVAGSATAATTTLDRAPLRTLTGLGIPYGIDVDAAGRLVVGSEGLPNTVRVFAPGASGDAVAARTIEGSAVDFPEDVAVDAKGNVYVIEAEDGAVHVFGPDADGTAAPLRTIAGAATLLDEDLASVAVGPDGSVYVGSWVGDHIWVFAPGADGDVAPVRHVTGPSTGLEGVEDLLVTPGGELYAVSHGNRSVRVFAPGANGDVAPRRVVTAPPGASLQGVALDSSGNLYVSDYNNKALHVFGPGASGEVDPVVSLKGGASGIASPWGIALDAERNVYTANKDDETVTVHAPLMPFTAPSPAVGVTVAGKPRAKSRTVSWKAPADDGGRDVAYRVTVRKKSRTLLSRTTTATTLEVTRKHLRSGGHTVSVVAFNQTGAAAAASAGFAVATIRPAKVRGVKVKGTKAAAKRTVRWKKPAWTGGAKVKRYRVVVKKGKQTLVREVVRAKKRSLKVARADLRAGKHVVRVQARNKVGYGAAGRASFRVKG